MKNLSGRLQPNRTDILIPVTSILNAGCRRGKFRYLTPRECLLFMGFEDKDYESLQANNPEQRVKSKLFPRDKIIRMAGNSIPVKMLEGFFYQLYKIEPIMEGN